MAFNTKLELNNNKFYQATGDTLSLCGSNAVGCAHYLTDKSAYFNVTPRAIPDVSWVTGKTTCGITTANNGLTKQGQNVKLGGSLTGDTTICTGAHEFCIAGNNTNTYFAGLCAVGNSAWFLGAGPAVGNQNASFSFQASTGRSCIEISAHNPSAPNTCALLRMYDDVFNTGNIQLITKTSGGNSVDFSMLAGINTFSDGINSKGIVYGGNYEANFTPLSLVTKQYVCSQTSGVTTCAITTAANGLTKTGQQVRLGGTLINTTTLTASGGTALLQYGGDYSANYVARTIVDAGYVTGKTACSEVISPKAITGVTNGLTKFDCHNACLGGAITGNVILCTTASNNFIVCSANNTATLSVNSGQTQMFVSTPLNCCSSNIQVQPNSLTISSTDNPAVKSATVSTFATTTCAVAMLRALDNISFCASFINVCPTCITVQGGSGFEGIKYSSAGYRSNFVCNSLVDAAYVTGKTNAITTNYICSANNGLIKQGNNVRLGGALTGNTCISGAYEFDLNTNKVNISGATGGVNLGGSSVALKNLVGGSNIICINSSTGVLGTTSVSALGGLTGATNGLHTLGQKVHLGGELIECTHIGGAFMWDIDAVQGFNIRTSGNTDMNIDAQGCGGFLIKSQCGSIDTFPDFTCAVGFLGHVTEPAGFAVYDNRNGACQTGIVYAANYSTNYVDRSLVDKQYVDSIATGLNVHTAVRLATTGAITLSGNQTIDGVLTITGDRILVKNQGIGVTGATTNGIYVAAAGAWSRATDYDGAPAGEVSNGDLIPVTSGNTNNNSLWALITLNPITVGVTPLIFSLFANTIDVEAGQGIAISMIGGIHTVCVNLATNCGLTFCGSGLAVNPLIAGTGLTYTNGVLDVNIAAGGAASSISVKRNAGNCLVINCADINSALNAITGATNGLTKAGQQVKLGGTLTGATTLTVSSTGALCFTDSRVGTAAVGLQYTGNYDANFTARSIVDAAYVTGKTTTAGIQTANNGLTKLGTNVVLGGLLTGNTCINSTSAFDLNLGVPGNLLKCFNVDASDNIDLSFGVGKCFQINTPTTPYLVINECLGDSVCLRDLAGSCIGFNCTCVNINGAGGAMTVSDSASKGLVYGGSYEANFTDLSLVDKFFVNNRLTGGTAILTANNGLTKQGTNVVLGGSLTGDTKIDLCLHKLQICGAPGAIYLFEIDDTSSANSCIKINSKCCTMVCGEGNILICTNTGTMSLGVAKGRITAPVSGLTYTADYSSTFVPASLVSKCYVDSLTSCGITTANNGLTKVGQNVVLGGTLTGDTCILGASAHNMCLGTTGSPLVGLCLCATTINIDGSSSVDLSRLTLNGNGPVTCIETFGAGGMTITDSALPTSKAVAEFVTGITTCGITLANNGLTKVGHSVVLGGALTGNTIICGAGSFDLTLCGASNTGIKVCSAGSVVVGRLDNTCAYFLTDSVQSASIHAKSVSACFDGTAANNICLKAPGAFVEIDGAGQYVALSGGTKLLTTPDAGTTSDSVIVWDSTDKYLKTVSGAALGDKNNIYSNTCIATSTLLTTGSSYVILVNTGIAVAVCLPATPKEGEAFKIKDATGNALLNNITICGNGHNIDGSACGLVNTDWGALELMYSSDPAGWYTLAFIN